VFYYCQFIGADVGAHRAFVSCSVQCQLLSAFCNFVIKQINDDDDSPERQISRRNVLVRKRTVMMTREDEMLALIRRLSLAMDNRYSRQCGCKQNYH